MHHRYSNTQNNRVRLTKESQQALREGDHEIADLLNEPVKKFEEGFMVAGGISYFGVSKLIFYIGTINSFSYAQVLKFYKEDINRLNKHLIFQQDNASSHT